MDSIVPNILVHIILYFLGNHSNNPFESDIWFVGNVDIYSLAKTKKKSKKTKTEVSSKSLEWQMLASATNDSWWCQSVRLNIARTGWTALGLSPKQLGIK